MTPSLGTAQGNSSKLAAHHGRFKALGELRRQETKLRLRNEP